MVGSADRRVRHACSRQAPAQGIGARPEFAQLSADERHRLRIALKKLRYATEFFEALYPKKHTKPYLAALKDLQDGLGHLNDVAVAQRLIDSLVVERDAERRGDGLSGPLAWCWVGTPAASPTWSLQSCVPGSEFAERPPFWR